MATRITTVLAAALTALALAGCTTATSGEPAGPGSTTAPAASGDAQAQAQQRAEEAEKIMLDPELPPREKYPKALGMFREALEIDPDNALAQQSITLIEDIYRSMGRPVPAT